MNAEALTYEIIGCALTIHKALGPGLLESAYQNCMGHELGRRGIPVETQVTLPLIYNGIRTRKGYRVDLLVDKRIIVEVKACSIIRHIDEAQVQTYLKLLNCRLGLLLNFRVRWMKDGIHRIVNPYFKDPRHPSR